MISGEDFIVLGDEFDVYPTVAEHLLRPFFATNRFLWVHLMGLRAPQLNVYDVRRAMHKVRQWTTRKPRAPVAPGEVTLYSPPLLPLPHSAARWWNRRRVIEGVRAHMVGQGFQQPIVFTSLPNAAEVMDAFGEKLLVYLCEDEYAEWPGVYKGYARAMEERLLARADLTFVTSRPLVLQKTRPGREAIHLPQGVDFEHFAAGGHRPQIPEELRALPRPIIGFAGLLNFRMDTAILAAVAHAYPEASIVIIGPLRTKLDAVQRHPNVIWLGQRPYRQLPDYVASFDVGLIPYRLTPATRYINPIKLLEYFAAGIPVVSTALPDVAAYGDVVGCARDTADFVQLVGRALRDTSPAARARRVALARENSWAARAEKLSAYIEAERAARLRVLVG